MDRIPAHSLDALVPMALLAAVEVANAWGVPVRSLRVVRAQRSPHGVWSAEVESNPQTTAPARLGVAGLPSPASALGALADHAANDSTTTEGA